MASHATILEWKKGEDRAMVGKGKEEEARERRDTVDRDSRGIGLRERFLTHVCARVCGAYRRPRIRDNVIDDDIERRSSRSRAFHRPRPLPLLGHGYETSFPINSCTDANGRLSPLDINDG